MNVQQTGGTVNLTGTLNNTGATLTLNATTGSWNLAGGTINGGILAFADGQTLLVTASSANRLVGVTVNGDLTLSQSSAVVRFNNVTLNGTAHLTNSSSIAFEGTQSFNSGTISFDDATGNVVEMQAAGTLTVGGTAAIRGNTGTIGGSRYFGAAMTLVNQGLISAEVSGKTLAVAATSFTNSGTSHALNGATLSINSANWSSTATIAETNSVLNLGGTFVTAGLNVQQTGGTVNLTGTLNNTGATLTLNATTGSWNLAGGTINGGILAFADGQTLLVTASSANRLVGVTVNGDLTLSQSSAVVRFNNVTLNGTAHLTNSSSIAFEGTQSFNSGTISFDDATGNVVEMQAAGTLTVGGTAAIRGNTGTIGGSRYFGAAMTLVNQGLISAEVSGKTLAVAATSFTNSGTSHALNGATLSINSANWSSTATIAETNSVLNLGGTFVTAGLNVQQTGGTVNLTGTLNNTGATLTLNATTGSWNLAGGTINGGILAFADGQTLLVTASSANRLVGVTVNGDLTLSQSSAVVRFNNVTLNGTAHLTNSSSIAFEGTQSFNSGTISFDDATGNVVEMQAAGTLTLGAAAAIRGNTGTIGGSRYFGAAMTLVNQGLISAEVSGRTLTVAATSFTNNGTSHALNGATLSINNLASPQSGTIGAGVGSTVTINGNITEGATGVINVDIGGTAAGQFGKISITGAATLAGTLTATIVNGFAPIVGNSFQVIAYASHSGTFGTTTGVSLPVGEGINPTYNATNLTITIAAALQASGGAATGSDGSGTTLTPDQLAPVLAAAIDRWAAAGLGTADISRLSGVNIQIGALPTGYLGLTTGSTIWIDATADNYGWFIDLSPNDDTEFISNGNATLIAAGSSPAAGKIDLLTVLDHELGHVLGLDDNAADDLMAVYLAAGSRRLPTAAEVDAVFAGSP